MNENDFKEILQCIYGQSEINGLYDIERMFRQDMDMGGDYREAVIGYFENFIDYLGGSIGAAAGQLTNQINRNLSEGELEPGITVLCNEADSIRYNAEQFNVGEESWAEPFVEELKWLLDEFRQSPSPDAGPSMDGG